MDIFYFSILRMRTRYQFQVPWKQREGIHFAATTIYTCCVICYCSKWALLLWWRCHGKFWMSNKSIYRLLFGFSFDFYWRMILIAFIIHRVRRTKQRECYVFTFFKCKFGILIGNFGCHFGHIRTSIQLKWWWKSMAQYYIRMGRKRFLLFFCCWLQLIQWIENVTLPL